MAFQQPRRPPVARPLSYTSPPPQDLAESSQQQTSPQRKRSLDESEEWVLFSPSAAGSTTGRTHTTSTERTPRTAGLSRLSDFGSLDTAARSEQLDDDLDEHVAADDAELDSLDDGLHAFHEPSQQLGESSQTVFPTHDGFGTFPGSSAAVQEQMMQFERYNVSRKAKQPRRRSSVQRRLDALEDAEGLEQDERRQRIERWRLEQSRALLEEIERETRRRRRMSRASLAKSVAAASTAGESSRASAANTHQNPAEDASFWRRFTKKVIRDLMGIDENLLSVIFGESLPAEAATSGSSSSASAERDVTASSEVRDAPDMALGRHETWEHRLLDRIARELGILVHQLSEHPGAFSTYLRTQEPLAYAGMSPQMGPQTARRPSNVSTAAESSATSTQTQSTPNIQFQPTLPPQTTTYSEASLWGIEEEPEPPFAYISSSAAAANAAQRDRDYWERDLDVKMVFNFLKDRFSSRPPGGSRPRRPSSSSPAYRRDSLFRDHQIQHRAALIRHHHPLVSRNLHQHYASPASNNAANTTTSNNNTTTITVPIPSPSAADAPSPTGRRSSCASQSTRRSRKSGSSRNYWDLGGSVGSAAGPAGGGVVAGVTMGEV
ncbi:uncharacterized protein J3D65DRAFT_558607 [Phyllosticta citribraziliensis]|uniref:Uncharacterized protein n=1 Tax=Phyllosticta citribraziliensis TaxID=989973 RepID=A0ABR1LC69_9PEZI